MTELDVLAEEIRISGRTLRRAAARGGIRCARPTPKRIAISAAEYEYVLRHWPMFERALEVLRTRPNVRLAVLFGSLSRGDEDETSDLDLLVRQRKDDWRERVEVADALEAAIGRPVQIVSLARAPALLLADVLRDGRVLVDRDGDWTRLRRRALAINHEAQAARDRLQREAWAVLHHPERLLR
jgi:predicted nucleotidyltransferase